MGMAWNQREYGAQWCGSKKAASQQQTESKGGGWGVCVVAMTQPGFYTGSKWHCTRGGCALRPWEATLNGSRCRASLPSGANGSARRG